MTRNAGLVLVLALLVLPMMIPLLPTSDDSTASLTVVDPASLAQTFNGGRILVDELHAGPTAEVWIPGNASLFGWILKEFGYNMSMNWDSSLDSGILDDYDVLCLFFPQIELTAGEVAAIHSFVDAGGGLLLVGVDYSTTNWEYTPAIMNPVSEQYGITFNTDDEMGQILRSAGQIEDHPLTYSVESLQSRNDQIAGCTLTTESPASSVATASENDFVAYSESGSGRIVAVGSSAPFTQYRRASGVQVGADDHFQFTVNVLDWLMDNSPREIVPPEVAVITAGDGPDINSTEIEEYAIFNGVIHEHTSVSDGTTSPWEMMLRTLEIGLDFLVVTDHSYESSAQNGIVGGLRVKEYRDLYNLDAFIVAGAEISRTPHMIGFPMTENIFTSDVQEAVDGIHAQGGIAVMSHPSLSPKHCEPYDRCEVIGYDAIEVDNGGFLHGEGESAYKIPFIGSNDLHSAERLGVIRNVLFVRDPSGPNGTLSNEDIMDAILNKRVVILDDLNDLVFGQKVWVDRFMDNWEDAQPTIDNAISQIDALELAGENVEIAKMYISDAERALQHWNPSRAIRLASDAVSDVILGIEVFPLGHNMGTREPNSDYTLSITFTNNLNTSLSFNTTPVISDALTFDLPSVLVEIGPNSSAIFDFDATVGDYGYAHVAFYVGDYNTTYKPKPIMVQASGFVPLVEFSEDLVEGGHSVTVLLRRNPRDYQMITSVAMQYTTEDDGPQTVQMTNYGNGYGVLIGPYAGETTIQIQITVNDVFGNTIVINWGTYQVEPDEETPGLGIEFILGGALAAVVVIIVLVRIRLRPS